MKTVKLLFEHLGEVSTTKRDPVAVYDPEKHVHLLDEKKSALVSHDMWAPVQVDRYKVGEVELPDWLDPARYTTSRNLQVKWKWFIGLGGNPEWPEQWFARLSELSEERRYIAIQLLNVGTFRSSFRQSLRNQLEGWLNDPEPQYASPFSHRQWECLTNRRIVREAQNKSRELYWSR